MDRMGRYQSRMRLRRDPTRGREMRAPQKYNEGDRVLREDAGWAMTDAEYAAYQESEEKFGTSYTEADTALAGQEASVSEKRGQVSAGYETLGDLTIDKAWSKFKKGFKPIRVVDGDNIEQTYYFPQKVIDTMNTDSFNKEGGYVGNWVDEGKNYNVDVTAGGGKRGKELHDSLRNGQDEVKALFYESQAPGLAKTQGELSGTLQEADVAVAGMEGAVEGDRATLEGYKGSREERKGEMATDFEDRRAGRRALMGVA